MNLIPLSSAEALAELTLGLRNTSRSIRRQPVIVSAADEINFHVVPLGFATTNDLPIVSPRDLVSV